jgi:ATP-binding cassette subfamily F protein uup
LKKASAAKPEANKAEMAKPKTGKLSFQETKELEELPAKIETLEAEQSDINVRLADATIYRDQPEEVKSLQRRLVDLEQQLTAALQRWESLESRG